MRIPTTLIRDSGLTVNVSSITAESLKETSFTGSFQGGLNSTLVIPTNGASTIGFHLLPPVNSVVGFEGQWSQDPEHWSDATFRQMGGDGYATLANDHEDWIGSVSTFTAIRFRVVSAGTGVGVVHGRFSNVASIVEGVEHGNMPHKIGATVHSKAFNIDKATPNVCLWQPEAGKRVVVTDLHFTVTDPATVVTFSDGSSSQSPVPIFEGEFRPPNGQSVFVPISFSLPHVFSATDRPLVFRQSASAQVIGVIHGYEAE